LKGAEAAAKKHGINIDVGDVKTVKEYTQAATDSEDIPQPIEVASRVIAHLFHRIPGIKKLGKRAEGKDKKAGILSDTLALVAQLMARNEDLVVDTGVKVAESAGNDLIQTLVKGFQSQTGVVSDDDEDVIHLGVIQPDSIPE
jgi:hypothetical protein